MEVMVELDLPAIMGDISRSDLDDVLNALVLRADASDILEVFYTETSYDEKLEFLDSALSDVDDEDLARLFGQLSSIENRNIKINSALQSMKDLERAGKLVVLKIEDLKE